MLNQRGLAAIERMLDQKVTITRTGPGPGTLNPVTGELTPVASPAVYAGPAGFGGRLSGQKRDDGFADRREDVMLLRLPSASPTIELDDEVTFDSGDLAGTAWEVIGTYPSSWQVTRRLKIRKVEQEVSQA